MAQVNRMGVAVVDGWRIVSVVTTSFEATKDGESVKLESDSIDGVTELIKLREEKHGES